MPLFEDSKIYKVKHVAEKVEGTDDFVWREIRDGRLRAIRLRPNFIRLRGSDLNEWLDRAMTTLATEENESCATK
jgi:hypothetical protein